MKFINTDGMAFIGPGSEWFWTALSGIVLSVTFIAIWRQLRLQRSQSAIEQLNRIEQEYASERLTRYALQIERSLRDGVDPADLPVQAAISVANFWERAGYLARRGYLDPKLLLEGGSGFYCQGDWVKLGPSVEASRARFKNPLIGEHFEWLAGVMAELSRRAGVPPDDATAQAARRSGTIAAFEAQLRVEEALRAVPVLSPGPEPATGVAIFPEGVEG